MATREWQCDCREEMRKAWRARQEINPRCDVEQPRKCPVQSSVVHTQCRKCGEILSIDFAHTNPADEGEVGILTRGEAEDLLAKHNFPRECPGYHVELGSWDFYWQFKGCINAMYGEEK